MKRNLRVLGLLLTVLLLLAACGGGEEPTAVPAEVAPTEAPRPKHQLKHQPPRKRSPRPKQ